ncbi:MAG: bifunctional (p)ppGpp synthetase/guanosine-3',5'-bis(diphosphate) 3'-pyrophosphohydrolase [Deltaproteobacteria bacterium]|nr:bifunctional (p)ppGpp synthetase/guanosine-3',5'-bis(diphosphate) 3'-pyrophosphohydrolase [Deltaproteobacteria bacterium]
MVRIDDVIDLFLKKRPQGDISRIQRAYIYSAKQHDGQLRKSGEPYMTHPLGVAQVIAEMGLDEPSICAALLHDTIEDTDATRDVIDDLFGGDIAILVDGVTKLSKVNFTQREERQAESFRKLLVAMSSDIRVLLVKLADRLHNMRTLEHMSRDARERIAQETHDIYAPLSDRLGISWLKADLDDLSFKYLESEQYADLSKRVDRTRKARQVFIQKTLKTMEGFLTETGFNVSVTGRLKNLYSIYNKMQEKGLDYEDVYDAIAFRVICKTVPDCYGILGLIHSRWVPVPGRFKDYIAMPKPNNYQSLHTTAVSKSGERVEVQIRTEGMHNVAEYGIAAHWIYKEGQKAEPSLDGFSWLREMVENQDEVRDATEFLDSVKVDLFRDEVFVFTPQGDVKSLRQGSSPIDFAYSVHTEVGNRCAGARVNGVQVPLRTKLNNGDMVEIVTSKTQRPSPDWLDIVASSRARNKIRGYLRTEQRKQSRHVGQELLEKALRRYGCSYNKMLKTGVVERVASELKFGNIEDLIAAVGYGKIEKEDVVERLLPEEKRAKPPAEVKEGPLEKVIRKVKGQDGGIVLDGLDNLLVRFARCCSPLPGEKIVGYVSRGRGIVIHRKDCQRATMLDPERQTNVQWSTKAVSSRPVKLKVVTSNRTGVLAALSSLFQNLNISINSAHCQTSGQNQGIHMFTFSVKDLTQLNQLIRSLRQSKDVMEVQRVHG